MPFVRVGVSYSTKLDLHLSFGYSLQVLLFNIVDLEACQIYLLHWQNRTATNIRRSVQQGCSLFWLYYSYPPIHKTNWFLFITFCCCCVLACVPFRRMIRVKADVMIREL